MSRSEPRIVPVDPATLSITHILEGEEVVCGDEDGQTFVASFAARITAQTFVGTSRALDLPVFGLRRIP